MELRTSRLLLRPFQPGDADAFAAFADDPAYRRYLGPDHPSPQQLVENNVAADRAREPSWVICMEGAVVGSIFLGVQPADRTAELACLLSPGVWGQGVAGEAGRAVVDFAFELMGMEKVFARAEAGNAASRRAMEKAGMRQEGLLRSHRGDRVDEVVYGLTRDDWQAGRG